MRTERQKRVGVKQKGKVNNLITVTVFFITLFICTVSVHALTAKIERIPFVADSSFLFSYKKHGKLLLSNYMNNQENLNRMKVCIKLHRQKLISGKAHLSIISYISAKDLKDPIERNSASLEAFVTRAYIKVKNNMPNKVYTFAFDTVASSIQDKRNDYVRVQYVDALIGKNENQTIDVTFSKSRQAIIKYMKHAQKVPIYNHPIFKPITKDSIPIKTPGLLAIDFLKFVKFQPVTVHPIVAQPQSSPAKFVEAVHQESFFYPLFSIKTNLIYLLRATPQLQMRYVMPNLEVEWYCGKHLSVNGDIVYAYMNKRNTTQETWGLVSYGIEPRYWVNKRYIGLYAGLYGAFGDFDNKLNRIEEQGKTGNFYEGGLSFGYFVPLSSHWGVEAGMRAGYHSENGDTYNTKTQGYYFKDGTLTNSKFRITTLRLLVNYRFGKSAKK